MGRKKKNYDLKITTISNGAVVNEQTMEKQTEAELKEKVYTPPTDLKHTPFTEIRLDTLTQKELTSLLSRTDVISNPSFFGMVHKAIGSTLSPEQKVLVGRLEATDREKAIARCNEIKRAFIPRIKPLFQQYVEEIEKEILPHLSIKNSGEAKTSTQIFKVSFPVGKTWDAGFKLEFSKQTLSLSPLEKARLDWEKAYSEENA